MVIHLLHSHSTNSTTGLNIQSQSEGIYWTNKIHKLNPLFITVSPSNLKHKLRKAKQCFCNEERKQRHEGRQQLDYIEIV